MRTREGAVINSINPEVFRRGRWIATRPVFQEIGQAMRAKTGRPRELPWDTYFTLLAIAAFVGNPGTLTLSEAQKVSRVLTVKQRKTLGLTGPVPYSQIESAAADLADAFNASVDTETGEIIKGPRLAMPLDDFTTRVVAGVLPRHIRRQSSTVAIDSTDAETHFRRRSWTPGKTADAVDGALPPAEVEVSDTPRRNEPGYPKVGDDGRYVHTCDPDMREGYRSGKNGKHKEVFIGMDLHLATAVPELGAPGHASLAFGFVARPAGDGKAEAGLALLDAMSSAGMPMKTVLADRGYTYLKAASWAGPLMDRGIDQVLDLHKNQRTVRPGPKPGMIWVDGGLFTAALPKHLRNLPGFPLVTTAKDKAKLVELYTEREAYAFKQMAAPDYSRRTVRLRGPARAGRLRCPNYPESMRRSPGMRPTTSCKPSGCACGDTVTVGPDDMLKERQKALFGTRAWAESYGRRSAIESFNASLKGAHFGLHRGSTQVKGANSTSILMAIIVAATNVNVMMAAYGPDVGLDHPEDVVVKPLPTSSKSSHRKERDFAHRNRSKPPPTDSGRPGTPSAWVSPEGAFDII